MEIIKLGDTVEDKYTKFRGVATAMVSYLEGESEMRVEPIEPSDPAQKLRWIETGRLQLVGAGG